MEEKLSRGELAEKYFREGYNCSQSVALSFLDVLPIDRSTLLKLSSSFGGGIGRLREVCGAFSGAVMVIGLLSGYDTPETGKVKADYYAMIQDFSQIFSGMSGGSIVCRELLHLGPGKDSPVPSERTPEFYKKRPCPELIRNSAELLDGFLREKKLI